MLKIMYDLVGNEKMQIRTTDLSKRPYNEKGEEKYAQYVNLVNRETNRCTQDSVRKNLFIEFHRMGFIERYNSKLEKNEVGQRAQTKYVSLTKLGTQIVKANLFQQNLIFTEAINQLFKNHNEAIFDILLQLTPQKITIEEMMYFISFFGKTYEGVVLGVDEIVELVKEYRRLSSAQKKHLNQMVKTICDPNLYHINKIDQRDFHNWKNEAQQIFNLLSQTVYFEVTENNSELVMRKNNGVYDTPKKLARSQTEKKSYFKEHNTTKVLGFDLHHIVPLHFSETQNDFLLYDKWENMIYINGTNHNIIHQKHSIHTIVDFDKNYLILKSYSNDFLRLENFKDVIFSESKIKTMFDYNQKLIIKD